MADIKQFKTFRDLPKAQNTSPSSASIARQSSTTSRPSNTSAPRTSTTAKESNIAPKRDFQKVPNSITREAVPSGLFRGKSKLIYDYLWSESRGAIIPTRMVKRSRREIMKQTAIGSMVTVDSALNHLQTTGLIRVVQNVGSLKGNQYEIFAPDEITHSSLTSISSISNPTHKVDELDILKSSSASTTQTSANKDTYIDAKTFFKDFLKIDDEKGVIEFFEILHKAAKEATGRTLTAKDLEALPNIARIITAEIDRVRNNTPQVNSYLKFTEAHLRNRLEAKTKTKPRRETLKDVSKTSEIEPLGESRSSILETLRSIQNEQGTEAVNTLQGNYLPKDWDWLISELNKTN